MTESDSGLLEERSTGDPRKGARAPVAGVGPKKHAVRQAIGLTISNEEQRNGVRIC